MLMRKFLGLTGVLLALGTLSLALPGCGSGDSSQAGPGGEVEPAPIVNPSPEALEPETGDEPD